ncbi:hypothetical protein DFR52_101504 [Hoeflea marina]|uniref:Uncharacterized protein n=1 Tax=Hoeflea marina TaxID=274592 RepID=A0A317PU95_9HYPH|nr:hypothetical protein DFR52_101504 [Hoeflea marina]
MALHSNTVYAILKDLLSQITNRPRPDITAEMSLRDRPPDGLGFTDPGLRQLSHRINPHFAGLGHPLSPPLVPSDTQGATKVKDLYVLIASRTK